MVTRRQRVAAYAVVVRDEEILLTRLAPYLVSEELWTLPGGGVEHGEDPRDAVVREVHEETGLDVEVGERAHVVSVHLPTGSRDGQRVDTHALALVFAGWVPPGSPPPRVVEVDGSTIDAAWHPVAAVRSGALPVVPLVPDALAAYRPAPHQRVAAYALVVQGERVLLTRVSGRGFHTGLWGLPGGGVEHGEAPVDTVAREVREETGLACEVGRLLSVDDVRVRGTAPSGRDEELHSVGIVYAASVPPGAEPQVVEVDGTTDAVAWIRLADIESGEVPVVDTVRTALAAR